MKMYTRWAAEYLRKPDKIGSLEVGKYADLLVIDRDYFTIPERDILKVHPLMTVVGGKTIVLQESLAKDFGVKAVGPAYNFTDADVAVVGKTLSDAERKLKESAPTEAM